MCRIDKVLCDMFENTSNMNNEIALLSGQEFQHIEYYIYYNFFTWRKYMCIICAIYTVKTHTKCLSLLGMEWEWVSCKETLS